MKTKTLASNILGIVFALLFVAAAPKGAETVFHGIPSEKVSESCIERVREQLPQEKAVSMRCVISKIGDDFYWATRENVQMIKIDGGGAFITFLAVNGSGYVRIIKPEMKQAASLMSETEKTFDYCEHMTLGLRSITYWGVTQ